MKIDDLMYSIGDGVVIHVTGKGWHGLKGTVVARATEDDPLGRVDEDWVEEIFKPVAQLPEEDIKLIVNEIECNEGAA